MEDFKMFRLCGNTYEYCNGKCLDCNKAYYETTNQTHFIRNNINYSNTTGNGLYDIELELERETNGKTSYTY